MYVVIPLSGISGLSFDSSFLSPLLFVCLCFLFFVSCLFFQKILKYFLFRVNGGFFVGVFFFFGGGGGG